MKQIIKNLTLFLLIFFVNQSCSQTIIKHPHSSQKLSDRWEWALEEAKQSNCRNGFWVGYSIERLMGENSYIGCFNTDRFEKETTLADIVYVKKIKPPENNLSDDEKIRKAAKKVLEGLENPKKANKKILKEVAFLFCFDKGSHKKKIISDVKISNLSLHVELDGKPLIWLGKSADSESVTFLEKQYKKTKSEDVKEDIITAVALHKTSNQVIDFLSDIISSKQSNDIREKAVFWIGEHETKRALKLLIKTAQGDRSIDVREKAVFSISRMEMDKANEALIDLAYNANNFEVRKKAIFWLGQKASKKAAKTLEDVAYNDEDLGIQKKAIFALSQLENNKGVPTLIKLAKTHPSKEIRKKAIFWLGQSNDPRALETLTKIVRNE